MTEKLKEKQEEFVRAFRSGKYRYLCAAGTTGSGKSFVDIGLLHVLCKNIPGVRFAVIRKSEKNLKQTSIPTYKKIKQATKSTNSSVIVDMTARYANGSELLFIWADLSKDPDLDNVKGLELTGALIEEANQIDKKYFDLLKTRIGRWQNQSCPAFILLNLNPSLGWVKDLFYDNHANNTMPEGHYFLQFDKGDARDCVGEEYLKTLGDLPPEEYKRYVLNNWDYSDVPNQLIKYEWYKQCIAEEPNIIRTDRALMAIDPSWEGDDATVFGRMHGTHIGWWEIYPQQDPDISGVLGYERCTEHNIKESDLVIDPVGVGASTVVKLRNDLKFYPSLFYGSIPSTDVFGLLGCKNKRSEAHWLLREGLKNEEITFTHHKDFQRQCLALKYSVDDKQIYIRPKKEIKAELKESPGCTDVAMMLIHKYKTESSELAQQLFDRQLSEGKTGASSRAQRERSKAKKEKTWY